MQRRKFKSCAYAPSMHSADWHVDVTVGTKGLSAMQKKKLGSVHKIRKVNAGFN